MRWEQTASDHFFDQMNLAQLVLHGRTPTGAIEPKIKSSIAARSKNSRERAPALRR
jgi:hypothetical protein